MRKQTDLSKSNVFEYLQQQQKKFTNTFFIASQEGYRDVTVGFPFRTFTYGIGLNYSTHHAKVQIGSTVFRTNAGSLSTVGPGIVCQWLGGAGGEFDTVYFSDDFFEDPVIASWLKALPFFQPGGNHVLRVDAMQQQQLKSLFNTLKQYREDKDKVRETLYAMLLITAGCHENPALPSSNIYTVHQKVANNFRKLLSACFLEQKSVAYYAKELELAPKHLSEILLEVTGRSAKAIILDFIILEAKSLLRQTEVSIQEISTWLGYDDFSYFTKAFKRKEGITPMAYRKL